MQSRVMQKWVIRGLLWLGLLASATPLRAEEYLTQEAFLASAFAHQPYRTEKLWLSFDQKKVAQAILGHDFNNLRVRYSVASQTTAWILEEIGKERPIKIGVVVADSKVQQVSILAFNESRGWEVKYPYFTDQFVDAALNPALRLDKNIDGITGATLSVRAVTNIARLALYFHQLTLAAP